MLCLYSNVCLPNSELRWGDALYSSQKFTHSSLHQRKFPTSRLSHEIFTSPPLNKFSHAIIVAVFTAAVSFFLNFMLYLHPCHANFDFN